MNKTFVSFFAVLFSLSAAVSYAQSPAKTQLSGKINQAVKSAQKRAVPAKLTTQVNLKWWEQGTLVHQKPRYGEDGTFQMDMSCKAILCNYKTEGKDLVVTVGMDKRCFESFDKASDAPFLVFSVDLGKYGSYPSGELAGEPFSFEMEVERDSQKKQEVFQHKNTKAGSLYVFNMPIRTPALQQALKRIFAKEGTVSLEKAAQTLKNAPKPQANSSFMAD